jgi:hypothetical protein
MPFHSVSVSEPSSITFDDAVAATAGVSMASKRDSKCRRKISIAPRAGDSSTEEEGEEGRGCLLGRSFIIIVVVWCCGWELECVNFCSNKVRLKFETYET